MSHIYEHWCSPDLLVALEDGGNVVLVTPERLITVTNVEDLIESLRIVRTLARALD